MKLIGLTSKQKIRQALEKFGRSLTTEEIVAETGIPKIKVNQVLNTYENNIVRVGPKTFDLAKRVYPGKTFRWTPSPLEVKEKVLMAEEDVHLFLVAAFNYWTNIMLVDEEGSTYQIKRMKKPRNLPFSCYLGLTTWFRRTGFEIGDDILFTCQSLKDFRFLIRRQKKQDRNEELIAQRNKKLANLVYDILLHSWTHSEQDLFLFRKYVYIYTFNNPVPPDNLRIALNRDGRFLITGRDRVLSISGHTLDDFLQICLRKYYFQNSKGGWSPVLLARDEYDRYGYCSQCDERLIWEKGSGWRHLKNDVEFVNAYITKEFLKSRDDS